MTQNTSFLKRQREPHFPTIAPQTKHFTIVNTWLAIIACLATMQRKVSTWRITSKCGGTRFCSLHSIFACCTPGHAGMCWGFPLCYQLGMRMEGQTSRHHQLGKQRHWVGSGTRASTLGQSSPRPMRKLEKKSPVKNCTHKKVQRHSKGILLRKWVSNGRRMCFGMSWETHERDCEKFYGIFIVWRTDYTLVETRSIKPLCIGTGLDRPVINESILQWEHWLQ